MSATAFRLSETGEAVSMARWLAEELEEPERLEFLAELGEAEQAALFSDWRFWARPEQLPPPGDWTIWAFVAGRGAGKTRAGAEWLLDRAEAVADAGGYHRGALVARTAGDVRSTMIEGESGLAACAERRGLYFHHFPSRREIDLGDLGKLETFSADEPDQLRGPQFHSGWCDEPAAWRHKVDAQGNTAWTNLLFGLRLDPPAGSGLIPQVCATTTPKPIPLVIEWFVKAGAIPDPMTGELAEPDPAVTISQASLYANLPHLSPAFVGMILSSYAGTRLGAQEIEGQLLSAVEGALWQPENIEPHRRKLAPALGRIVVAIDPAASPTGAETGIVVAGAEEGGQPWERHAYVLDDVSIRGRTEQWATAAVRAFEGWEADAIVAEKNNGGDMVRAAIHAVEPSIPVKLVTASRGKQIRAEPIALLYEKGRVHHVGMFGLLEAQLLSWVPGEGESPDRLDALVWAISDLLPRLASAGASSKSASASGARVATGAAAARRSGTRPGPSPRARRGPQRRR